MWRVNKTIQTKSVKTLRTITEARQKNSNEVHVT